MWSGRWSAPLLLVKPERLAGELFGRIRIAAESMRLWTMGGRPASAPQLRTRTRTPDQASFDAPLQGISPRVRDCSMARGTFPNASPALQ